MSRVPRNYYLVVHDALRKLLGPDAQLAAFVKAKHRFQCDMLVNDTRTDEATLSRVGRQTTAASSGFVTQEERDKAIKVGVQHFALELQGMLGVCDVVPHTRRVDVIFRDRSVLQLALGAAKRDVPFPLHKGEDINQEPDWHQRNRLRISLGYDEDLFLAQCTRSVNVAARSLEKSAYDFVFSSAMLHTNTAMREMYEAAGRDWKAVLPPVTYWQAHCHALQEAYACRHYQQLSATVEHNFAEYFEVFPMRNPYCDGEDLNTIQVVQWLCAAQKTGALLNDRSLISHDVAPPVRQVVFSTQATTESGAAASDGQGGQALSSPLP